MQKKKSELLLKAKEALEHGDQKAVENYYKEILILEPDLAEIYNNLGALYDRQRDFDKALKHYAKAVNLQPDYIQAHYNLGFLFLKRGKSEEALIQLNNVLSLNPHHKNIHKLLADIYLQSDRVSDAIPHYKKHIQNKPEDVDALNNLGAAYLKSNNPEKAMKYFTKALAIDDNHKDARNNLAATYLQHDRYDNAMRHYEVLLKLDPDNFEAHYNIAVAEMAVGELQKSVSHFQFILEREPNHIDAAVNLAAVYLKLRFLDRAIETYQNVLKVDSNHAVAKYMLHALTNDVSSASPDSAPTDYVKNLFDNYAGYYDKHTTEVLRYQLPNLMRKLIDDLDSEKKPKPPWSILDLGCGTGLSGKIFSDMASQLVGVDISKKMLDYARLKGVYHQLIEGDILSVLQQRVNENKNKKITNIDEKSRVSSDFEEFDLIIAADVFVYIGALSKIFRAASELLADQGLILFSVEAMSNIAEEGSAETQSFILQKTARYAHSEAYLEMLAEDSGLKILLKEPIIPRYQEDSPVNGWFYILGKTTVIDAIEVSLSEA